MNKRGLIKFIFVFIAAFISLYFMIKTSDNGFNSMFNIVMILNFILSLTIFIFSNKNKIKSNKFIYDVILLILIIISSVYFLYFCYSEFSCIFDSSCELESNTVFTIIYPVFLFLLILFSFYDIFNETNKTNDILTVTVSGLIILTHLRYYYDPKFIHNTLMNSTYDQYSYYYVTQNYIYFIIMYLVVLMHRSVNTKV